MCKKDYSWNPSTCICEISLNPSTCVCEIIVYLKGIVDDSAIVSRNVENTTPTK